MLRIRLRTAMITVAALAFLLGLGVGLHRRSQRLWARGIQYGSVANRLEDAWVQSGPIPPGQTDQLVEQIHWNDSVAGAFLAAAGRPWLPFDPDPRQITCRCGFHAASKATASR